MTKLRFKLLFAVLIFSLLAIFARLFYLQILKGKEYHTIVEHNHYKPSLIVSRGDLVDRNEKVLALDLDKFILEFNPINTEPEELKNLSQNLAKIFDFPVSKQKLLYKNSSQTLKHNLDINQAQKIRKLNSLNLFMRKIRTRFYPNDSLMSHVVGFVDNYGIAKQGAEFSFDQQLKQDSKSQVPLSLDFGLQSYTEKILKEKLITSEAQKATAIVMKVKTGEILAWATFPDYNPNEYHKHSYKQLKNWSLTDVYQPGSVFKILTASIALDLGVIDYDYTYLDKGIEKVGGASFTNHDYVRGRSKAELLDIQGFFERSSNPFAATISQKIGARNYYNYLHRFGFGKKTGIELPGETKSIVHNYKSWRAADLASTSIGQGVIAVTPLQTIAGINTIANNGIWVKPTIKKYNAQQAQLEFDLAHRKAIKTSKKSVNEILPSNKRRVIKEEVAKFVQRKLTASIQNNIEIKHAQSGKIEGLVVAGKTGTSQKLVNGKYSARATIASFIGFFPNPEPKYICLVVVDDPKIAGGWGETISGPVFNRIAQYMKNHYL